MHNNEAPNDQNLIDITDVDSTSDNVHLTQY